MVLLVTKDVSSRHHMQTLPDRMIPVSLKIFTGFLEYTGPVDFAIFTASLIRKDNHILTISNNFRILLVIINPVLFVFLSESLAQFQVNSSSHPIKYVLFTSSELRCPKHAVMRCSVDFKLIGSNCYCVSVSHFGSPLKNYALVIPSEVSCICFLNFPYTFSLLNFSFSFFFIVKFGNSFFVVPLLIDLCLSAILSLFNINSH